MHLEHAKVNTGRGSPVSQLGAEVGEPIEVSLRHRKVSDRHEAVRLPARLLEEHHAGQVQGPLEPD